MKTIMLLFCFLGTAVAVPVHSGVRSVHGGVAASNSRELLMWMMMNGANMGGNAGWPPQMTPANGLPPQQMRPPRQRTPLLVSQQPQLQQGQVLQMVSMFRNLPGTPQVPVQPRILQLQTFPERVQVPVQPNIQGQQQLLPSYRFVPLTQLLAQGPGVHAQQVNPQTGFIPRRQSGMSLPGLNMQLPALAVNIPQLVPQSFSGSSEHLVQMSTGVLIPIVVDPAVPGVPAIEMPVPGGILPNPGGNPSTQGGDTPIPGNPVGGQPTVPTGVRKIAPTAEVSVTDAVNQGIFQPVAGATPTAAGLKKTVQDEDRPDVIFVEPSPPCDTIPNGMKQLTFSSELITVSPAEASITISSVTNSMPKNKWHIASKAGLRGDIAGSLKAAGKKPIQNY
nr:PREDICTED: uncharacterized protein LOC102360719 [Latimeria chalumnae]|eukprot:XP_006011893.1 PREDICTED: uncharacterized protein LOC102360719 [Latimeria chalumnae]